MKCCIQWIDSRGEPTPDENPAIGMATCCFFAANESKSFPICEAHLARMPVGRNFFQGEPISEWSFEPFGDPFPEGVPPEQLGEKVVGGDWEGHEPNTWNGS